MTLLEYITSLQDTGLSQEEIFAKAQEFKGRTKTKEVEVSETPVEEVKTEVVAEEGVPAATTPVTPESSSFGSGESVSQNSPKNPFYNLYNYSKGIVKRNQAIDDYREYKKKYETVAKTGEEYNPEDDSFKYKFEVTPDNKLAYYYKGPNSNDFVLQEDEYASVKIGQKFNHYDEDQLEIIKL